MREYQKRKNQELKIGNQTLKKPIFQGGMGIGISLSSLAGAVAKEGGAGTISAAQIGFREPDFMKDPLRANLRAMDQELKKAREIAPEGVIGFNIMVAMRHYEEYVEQAVRSGADYIVSGAGLPVDLPALVKESEIKIAPIVSTEKAAKVILRYWSKKYDRVPDFIVIEGPMAGGHLGFHKEEIEKYQQEESENIYRPEVEKIIRKVREYEEKYERKIPIVLGGGISDREKAECAFKTGVDAIQVASRFVTTVECDADIRYKMSYVNAGKEDIVITKSPVGMPGRAIRNRLLEQVENGLYQRPSRCLGCLAKCDPSKIPYCITESLIYAAKGDVDRGLLFCGADAYRADKIETVKLVIDSLL